MNKDEVAKKLKKVHYEQCSTYKAWWKNKKSGPECMNKGCGQILIRFTDSSYGTLKIEPSYEIKSYYNSKCKGFRIMARGVENSL